MKTLQHLRTFLSHVSQNTDFKFFKTKDMPISDIMGNSMSGTFAIIKEKIFFGTTEFVIVADADNVNENTYIIPICELRNDIEYIKENSLL